MRDLTEFVHIIARPLVLSALPSGWKLSTWQSVSL